MFLFHIKIYLSSFEAGNCVGFFNTTRQRLKVTGYLTKVASDHADGQQVWIYYRPAGSSKVWEMSKRTKNATKNSSCSL